MANNSTMSPLPQAFPLSFNICICRMLWAGRHKCTSWCIFEGILVLRLHAYTKRQHASTHFFLCDPKSRVPLANLEHSFARCTQSRCSVLHKTDEDSIWTKPYGLIAFLQLGLASACRPVSYQVLMVDTCRFCAHARLENSQGRLYQV